MTIETKTHRTRHHEQVETTEQILAALEAKVQEARDRLVRHRLAALVAELDEEHPDNPPVTITVLTWEDETGEGEPFEVSSDEVLHADGHLLTNLGGEVAWMGTDDDAVLGWSDGNGSIDVAQVRKWAVKN